MKAVAIQAFGSPEGLAVIDLPDPSPASGQVLIDIEAIGVGGVDAVIRSGAVAVYGFTEGHVLGGEIAGTVAAVGDGTAIRPGSVSACGRSSAWAAATPSERSLGPWRSSPTGEHVGRRRGDHWGLRSGSPFRPAARPLHSRGSVLVRGAADGIGVMIVQLAVRGGASAVAVTTSSAERGDRLRKLGATHVLDRSGAGDDDAPAGYDVIIDIVAGTDLPSFFARLNPNGRMVAVGIVAGSPPADFATEMFAAFQKSMSFATFSGDTMAEADRLAVTAELFSAASRGELQTMVHELLPLEQAVRAHRKMEAGEVFGRIVLTPPGSKVAETRKTLPGTTEN